VRREGEGKDKLNLLKNCKLLVINVVFFENFSGEDILDDSASAGRYFLWENWKQVIREWRGSIKTVGRCAQIPTEKAAEDSRTPRPRELSGVPANAQASLSVPMYRDPLPPSD
jgi:hypothetical protein